MSETPSLSTTAFTATAAILMLTVALGVTTWKVSPPLAWVWAAAILFLFTIWLALLLRRRTVGHTSEGERDILRSVGVAGLILAAALGAVLAQRNLLPADASQALSRRSMGVLMGLVLAYYANVVPKKLTPLSEGRCEPTRMQALQRFAGWVLVLAGLIYSICWLVAPLELARVVSMAALASGVALVGARTTWSAIRR